MSALPAAPHEELLPDEAGIEDMLSLFKHADAKSYILLRGFLENSEGGRAIVCDGFRLDDPELRTKLWAAAHRAANSKKSVVFCPPLATFDNPRVGAKSKVADGLVLSVECDAKPIAALAKLREVFGEPTLVVASGGRWQNPDTGTDEPKLHVHYRLTRAARTKAAHADLTELRELATRLVDADRSNIPLGHPMRWAGGFHLKTGAAIPVTVNSRSDHEIDLQLALSIARAATPPAVAAEVGARRQAASSAKLAAEFEEDALDAFRQLRNDEESCPDWNAWKRRLMMLHGACRGSEQGRDVAHEHDAQSPKYDPETTDAEWDRLSSSPPTEIGAGALFYEARLASPEWSKPSSRPAAVVARSQALMDAPADPHVEPVERVLDYNDSGRGTTNATATSVGSQSAANGHPHERGGPSIEPSSSSRPAGTAAGGRGHNSDGRVPSEDALADEFAELFEDRLRFDHERGAWFIAGANGLWLRDATRQAVQLAREHVRAAAREVNDKTKLTLGKAAVAGSVEQLARSDRRLAVTSDIWDRDPMLLGTPGGTVDLRTGTLSPTRRQDCITMSAAVVPAPDETCPLWLAFLEQATGGDAELMRFLAQWAGYCLTGVTQEQVLVFLHGPGGNGKSVFANIISWILGAYAKSAPADTFMAAHGDRHPTDLAMLRGARMVTASETEAGRHWAEARVKAITGGDVISARFMRGDFFEFRPTLKLTIIGNSQPALNNVDDAARRRFIMVPFVRKPEKPDPHLEEKLRAEGPAILRWMINGGLDWQANGLTRPSSVTSATDEFFAEQDTFGEWLADRCDVGVGKRATSQGLFESWASFCKARNEASGTQKSFAAKLSQQRFASEKNVPRPAGGYGRGFRGIELRSEPWPEMPS